MRLLRDATVSRGAFIRGAAGGLALAALGGPLAPLQAAAAEMGDNEEVGLVTPPKPIVRVITGTTFHVHAPGPTTIVLPHSGVVPDGLDAEPNTITDFKGFIAQAYHVGTATGSDGLHYNLETDIRGYKGEYIAADGSHHTGAFALL